MATPCHSFRNPKAGAHYRCGACGNTREEHKGRPAPEDVPAGHVDHVLPDSGRIRLYNHGGIDVLCDDGKWRSVATTPEACDALMRIIEGRPGA